MDISAERDALAAALSVAGRATTTLKSSSMMPPALRLTATGTSLEVVGTDGDLTITTLTDIPVSRDDGTVVAPAKLLPAIVGALRPGAVSLKTTSDALDIKAGRSAFTLRVFPESNFPLVETVEAPQVTVEAKLLQHTLNQVVFAASPDAFRPVLTGVLMEAQPDGIRLVATDSYRLAVRDIPGLRVLADGHKALVPGRALSELQRLLGTTDNIDIFPGERQVAFQVGPTRLMCRLIVGDFPPYRQLLPTATLPNRLTVESEPLLGAIKRVALVAAGDKTTPVRLSLTADGVELALTSDGATASERVDAKYEGEDVTLGFNPSFLTEGIAALGTDTAIMELTDAVKPVILTGVDGDGGCTQLLMPVRIS